jgi:EmrB/QacA subfamily drug resistance transporter
MAAITVLKNRVALTAVCLSAIMLGLEITSIPSILPTLERVLPAEFRQLQWIMNAYTIAMCSVLVAMGALADRFGRKRVFIVSILVFGVASLICGLAINAPLLIGARFLQGISAAGMLACQVAILSHQFRNGPERGVAFAWWGIIFGLGLGFGPIIGGIIVTLSSWEWVFFIHVIMALFAVAFALMGVEESADPHAISIDISGMVTLSLAVFGLVYLITQGQELGLNSPAAMTVLAVSAISLLLFVFNESRVARPMFDFKVFRIRNFSGALLGASGMNFSFWPFIIYFPIYLQSVLGYSSIMAGFTVLAYTLPTMIMPPVAEKLLLKRGPSFVIPLGLFTIATGFVVMRVVATTEYASWVTLLPGCVLAGIGLGLTNTPVTNTATGSLPQERAGMASGMEFSARMISLAVNIAIMGFVLVKGVSLKLGEAVADTTSPKALRTLADAVAAGNLHAGEGIGIAADVARSALTYGAGCVMTYGAIAAFVLGITAVFVFGKKESPDLKDNQPVGEISGRQSPLSEAE